MLDARAGQDTVIVAVNRLRTEACTVPDGLELEVGDMVVIRDEEAEDVGRVVDLSDAEEAQTEVLRRATEEEVALRQAVDREDGRALDVFNRLRQQHRLDMRVVGAHWRLDRRKVYLYFASESRTDFRALHRAITGALGARVAIRQVGVRDHARLLGGLGACGRELCCARFIRELKPIALRMARQQNLFVEPGKISGLCGKLLCCLSFEDEAYQQWIKEMPRVGDDILTEHGHGTVIGVDAVKRRLHVRYPNGTEETVALEAVGTHPVGHRVERE